MTSPLDEGRCPSRVALPVAALMTPGQPLAAPPEAEAAGRALVVEGLSPAHFEPFPLWAWFWAVEPPGWTCWTEWRRVR